MSKVSSKGGDESMKCQAIGCKRTAILAERSMYKNPQLKPLKDPFIIETPLCWAHAELIKDEAVQFTELIQLEVISH